jgi:hypothetical protein
MAAKSKSASRIDSYRKGYASGLAGKELANPYKLRGRAAGFERGYYAGCHGRYLVNAATRAEAAFAEHNRGDCLGCLRSLFYRSRPCPDAFSLMGDTIRAFAALSPLDRAAFTAWQSHYYARPVDESDVDLLAAFA